MTSKRFDLVGKIALVTGGSRGIGRGIAMGLAEHGADVAIVYRSAETGPGRRAPAFDRRSAQLIFETSQP